ncbi:hypothetical protein [Sphingomonas colocasiae]|uniref:Uncharacterized protein n=1 Tax=Sphingomonas colocasiae TaxID=1848973 RepID=A0ABS7PVE2_9SPHN|nr:hypothetical protein [Sphingomonas colocasiae]MBY8825327.1 hypothetical protein [Sphingomonas colocasiae]
MRLFLFWIALLTPYFAAENYNDIDVDFQRQKYKITSEQVHIEERLKLLDEKIYYISSGVCENASRKIILDNISHSINKIVDRYNTLMSRYVAGDILLLEYYDCPKVMYRKFYKMVREAASEIKALDAAVQQLEAMRLSSS